MCQEGQIEVDVKMTLRQMKTAIKKFDPQVKEGDDAYAVYLTLLAGVEVGAFPAKIANFTGVDVQFVRKVGRRLRKAGIWKDGMTHADWADEKHGGIAFACDAAVGMGWLDRVSQ